MAAPGGSVFAVANNGDIAMLSQTPAHPALVAKTDFRTQDEQYLRMMPAGLPAWVADPEDATAFASMREAMRMAMRLPAALRAYGLPREAELAVHRPH